MISWIILELLDYSCIKGIALEIDYYTSSMAPFN